MQLMGHGPAVTGLSSEDAASAGATLMGTPQLKGMSDSEFKAGIWADVVGCVSSRTTWVLCGAALMWELPSSWPISSLSSEDAAGAWATLMGLLQPKGLPCQRFGMGGLTAISR